MGENLEDSPFCCPLYWLRLFEVGHCWCETLWCWPNIRPQRKPPVPESSEWERPKSVRKSKELLIESIDFMAFILERWVYVSVERDPLILLIAIHGLWQLLKSSLPFGCRRGRHREHGGWAWPARWRWRWWGRKWRPRWEPKAGQRWQPADDRSSSVSRWTKRTKCARLDRIRERHPVQPEHLQSSTEKANEIQFIIAGFIHQRDAKTRLLIEIFLAANTFFPWRMQGNSSKEKSFSLNSSDTWWSCQNVRDDGR